MPPGAEGVSGTITIAPELRGRAATTDTLFVIARNAGSNEIVAVRKEQGVQFPFTFQISGADAMTAGSSFTGPFDITARLSKSGDAVAASGDLEGMARGVAAGSNAVEIVLSTVRQ
jgi:cytochrome c-type biogenesis protein CcmH